MFPARFSPVLFGLILSGLMSCMVSGIVTLRAIGLADGFVVPWGVSWGIAFPVVLVMAPITRKIVARLIRPAGA